MELTREKVLAMGAGREMNSLIAENVMKWYITKGEYSGKEYWNDSDDYSHYSVQGFNPSTHIFAAWEVLEKLVDNGFTVGASKYAENNLYYAHVLKNGVDICDVQMMSSAPEAICKAALLTTLTEQEDNQ